MIEAFSDKLFFIVQLFDVTRQVTRQHCFLKCVESFRGEPLAFEMCDDRCFPVETRFNETRRDDESDVIDETFLDGHVDDELLGGGVRFGRGEELGRHGEGAADCEDGCSAVAPVPSLQFVS